MTLSAAHRPLNPPFRRAPVSNVRRDKVGGGIRRGVFGTFCGQKYKVPRGRRPRLFLFRYKRECGGLKPLPEARAGFCANMGEHANKGCSPMFACSRVRKAGFIRPRMQNADSAHTLHLRLHFITHITWVNAPCNGCNAVKRHTLFPII